MSTTEQAEKAAADIDRDPMWHRAYMDVQAVLDKPLGAEEEDGAGAGIAADVWLLARQRDEARAQVAQMAARLKDLTEPGLLPAAGPARVSTHWAVAWGSENLNDGTGFVEQWDDEEDARGHVRYYKGGRVVRRTVISLPWEAVPGEEPSP